MVGNYQVVQAQSRGAQQTDFHETSTSTVIINTPYTTVYDETFPVDGDWSYRPVYETVRWWPTTESDDPYWPPTPPSIPESYTSGVEVPAVVDGLLMYSPSTVQIQPYADPTYWSWLGGGWGVQQLWMAYPLESSHHPMSLFSNPPGNGSFVEVTVARLPDPRYTWNNGGVSGAYRSFASGMVMVINARTYPGYFLPESPSVVIGNDLNDYPDYTGVWWKITYSSPADLIYIINSTAYSPSGYDSTVKHYGLMEGDVIRIEFDDNDNYFFSFADRFLAGSEMRVYVNDVFMDSVIYYNWYSPYASVPALSMKWAYGYNVGSPTSQADAQARLDAVYYANQIFDYSTMAFGEVRMGNYGNFYDSHIEHERPIHDTGTVVQQNSRVATPDKTVVQAQSPGVFT